MSQSVTATKIGVDKNEATQNAAIHGAHDRTTVKGVTAAEATANAVANSASASE